MRSSVLLICVFILSFGMAQQDPQFTQFYNNRLMFNPGYSGMNGLLCAGSNFRSQWVGFPGAPKTFSAWINSRSNFLRGGLSVHFTRDQLGFEKNTRIIGSYSKHIVIGATRLGVGVGLNMQQKTLDGNWIAPQGTSGDNSIPSPTSHDWLAGMDGGAYFQSNRLYAGLSTSQITQGVFKDGTVGFKTARHYFATAGFRFTPAFARNWDLRTHFLAKTDAKATTFDLHTQAWYMDQLYAGVGYRPGDAVMFSAGIRLSGLVVGYSFDVTTSALKNHSSNTHEISIRYCFPIHKRIIDHRIENPRFMWGDRNNKPKSDIYTTESFNSDW